MRYAFNKTLTCIGLVITFVAALFAYADDATSGPTLTTDGLMTPQTRAVVRGENAYLLGPVETITQTSSVSEISVSSDSGAVLITANKSRPYRSIALAKSEVEAGMAQRFPEWSLVYWDVRTRVARTLLRETVPEHESYLSGIKWMPQTRIALARLSRSAPSTQEYPFNVSLMRIDPVAGTVRRVTDLEPGMTFEVCQNHPIAVIRGRAIQGKEGHPGTPATLQVYTPQGLGRVIRMENEIGALRWTPDGKSVYATSFSVRTADGTRTVQKLLTLVNLETAEVTHPEKLPTFLKEEAGSSPYDGWTAGPVTTNVTVQGPLGQKQDTTAVWVRGAAPSADTAIPGTGAGAGVPPSVNQAFVSDALMVATNAKLEGYLVNQDKAAVLFTRDGSVCAAPVFRVSRTAFEQGIRGVHKQMAMTNAKQVGLGLLMYAQDYDENFPQTGGGLTKTLQPYLKSDAVFKNPATGEPGFVYTYTGPTSFAEIALIAETQLGYVSGPGGRAIIWADGHVTWQDDPPTP